ncbi:choice-of-anchor J domain-containing protein [Barnesiella propionica]|uniref:choice-of-anchor J domain-containing protein n=1 Tax=Barnesiella propionica TaxID=2981781 RepID=UPI0011C7100D|nr:choice-of-anchor J domain-containing protein [Barnesiella propionica]MCU6767553.1 choice-of-anchor J domain-containing protein [Barnesiella propionica]
MRKITLVSILTVLCSVMSVSGYSQKTVPYSFDFSDAEAFGQEWSIIDVSGGNTWSLNENSEVLYVGEKSNKANDWLFTPGITLENGKAYKLVFRVKTEEAYNFDYESFKVTLGADKTVEAQTQILFNDDRFKCNYYADKEATVSVTETGTYYIAFNCYSPSYMGKIYIKNVTLTEQKTFPAQITDLTISAGSEGALAAQLSWTAPSKNDQGGSLSSLSGTKIYRNNDSIFDLAGTTPGAAITWTDNSVPAAGTYTYKLVAYNENGNAAGTPKNVTSPWIGIDIPTAVTDITATAENSTVSLSFTPPATGKNGGWVDVNALTYRIVRNPGNTVLEEAYTGTLPYTDEVQDLAAYTYTVVPSNASGTGPSANSNKVIAGNAKSIPYSETFDTADALDIYTIFSNIGNTRTWAYYSSKKLVQYWGGTKADEWLITPKFDLKAGKNYKLTFDTYLESATSANEKDLRITLGQGVTVEQQSQLLDSIHLDYALPRTIEIIFYVENDGNWNIGFNCFGKSSSYAIFIDNIKLEETEITPGPVSDLQVTPGENGAMTALVSWKNTTETASGSPVDNLSKVELYRGDLCIHTIDHPVAGAEESYTDNLETAGKYTYGVVAYIGALPGEKTTVESSWIGADVPGPVTDITVKAEGTNAVITFKAPKEGVNGGWLDTENLTYKIVRNPGEELLVENLADTVYTDQDEKSLAAYTYVITAVSNGTESASATSPKIVMGDALELPYEAKMEREEDFAIWSILDADQNGKCWQYNADKWCVELPTSSKTNDDWLFTPPFKADRGSHKLLFSVKTGAYSSRYTEHLRITLGTSSNDTTTHTTIAEYPELVQLTYFKEYEVDFDIPEEGVWYLGFEVLTEDGSWGVSMQNFTIKKGPTSHIGSTREQKVYYDRRNQILAIVPGEILNELTVSNMSGARLLHKEHVGSSVSLEQLPEGIYLASYTTSEGKTETIKLVK